MASHGGKRARGRATAPAFPFATAGGRGAEGAEGGAGDGRVVPERKASTAVGRSHDARARSAAASSSVGRSAMARRVAIFSCWEGEAEAEDIVGEGEVEMRIFSRVGRHDREGEEGVYEAEATVS